MNQFQQELQRALGQEQALSQNSDNNGKAMFDPAVAGAGTHAILYTYTDINGCTSEMGSANASTDIIVNALPVLQIEPATSTSVCVNSMGVLEATPAPATGTVVLDWSRSY